MNSVTQFKTAVFLVLTFACFGLLPVGQALSPPPDGDYPGANTAEGSGALDSLSFNPNVRAGAGVHNTALGYQTLFSDTTGNYNTATGSQALKSNTSSRDTANGYQALFSNTEGTDNTAVGYQAAFSNIGNVNAGLGFYNTAVGSQALYSNLQGSDNTAIGYRALYSDTGGVAPGIANTAIGSQALRNNTTGAFNIALGYFAGYNLTSGIYNICIGNKGFDTDSHTIRIGDSGFQTATFIAGIYGTPIVGGAPVVVNANGQLGIAAVASSLPSARSTRRFKQDILRHEAINAKLRSDLLKEHRKAQQLEAALKAINNRLKEQEAKIEKVSAQLEASKPAPQIVENNR
jgi:hypothetical protein